MQKLIPRNNPDLTCALSVQSVKVATHSVTARQREAACQGGRGYVIPQLSRRARARTGVHDICTRQTLPTRRDLEAVIIEIAATGVANVLAGKNMSIERMQLQEFADVPGDVDLADPGDIA